MLISAAQILIILVYYRAYAYSSARSMHVNKDVITLCSITSMFIAAVTAACVG